MENNFQWKNFKVLAFISTNKQIWFQTDLSIPEGSSHGTNNLARGGSLTHNHCSKEPGVAVHLKV